MKQVRWLVGVLLVLVVLGGVAEIAMAKAVDIDKIDIDKQKFNYKEYKKQLYELAKIAQELNFKVKNGEITKKDAENLILTLINNDLKYRQVKLMKEYIEKKRNFELKMERPHGIPKKDDYKIVEDKLAVFDKNNTYYILLLWC